METTLLAEATAPYLGQWKRLVSTTNWEKGLIICEWREALVAADAPVAEYSDDAWSRQVGGITPQHVGRLRRVFDRFGETRGTYAGLYWSHFQAAIDWNDAEMWLEGAVQSDWSVAQMRQQRWQALGAPDALKPRDEDIVTSELDEDAEPDHDDALRETDSMLRSVRSASDESADEYGNSEFAGRDASASDDADHGQRADEGSSTATALVEPRRPFADLPSLPTDVTDAFESFKLCILRHKLDGWREIGREDLLASLDALKELALAPSES